MSEDERSIRLPIERWTAAVRAGDLDRLRISFGPWKEAGRWVVAHAHRSIPA